MADRLRSFVRTVAVVLAATLLLTPSAVVAQDLAAYTSLVDRWMAGDADGAATALAGWSRSDVTAATKAWARTAPAARLRQTVMLHTDLGYALIVGTAPGAGAFHMAVAQGMVQRVVQALPPREREVTPDGIFAQRWHEMVASVFTGQGMLNDADWIVRSGLTLFPRDAMLYVARGMIFEERVTLNVLNAPGTAQGHFPRMTSAKVLDLAAADYRRAVQLDPSRAIASLRLGWLHLRLGDGRAARELDAAFEHVTDDRTRYVAHLLRGQAAERGGQLDAAREQYESALAIGGGYQTAYVAASRVHEALGQRDQARSVALDYALLPKKAEDPWWDFNLGGFDSSTLAWLREEARRP